MKSKWKVTANLVDGQMYYSAVKIRDIDQIDHSGNREYQGDWYTDRKMVEELVEELNKKEVMSE